MCSLRRLVDQTVHVKTSATPPDDDHSALPQSDIATPPRALGGARPPSWEAHGEPQHFVNLYTYIGEASIAHHTRREQSAKSLTER